MRKTGFLTLLLTVSAASPALAVTLPRVTDNAWDFFLMPFLGYLAILVGSRLVSLVTSSAGRRGL